MTELDWDRWPNFSKEEMACSCCGEAKMDPDFMDRLQSIRWYYGAMKITSAYRCPNHPAERKKKKPGTGMHSQGRAVDVASTGGSRMLLIQIALGQGMRGFGFGRTFQHLDDRENYASWTY